MSTYIISIFSHHAGDNQCFEVDANTACDGAKKALIAHCDEKYRTEDFIKWVNGLGDSYEDIQENAAEGELILSNFYKV